MKTHKNFTRGIIFLALVLFSFSFVSSVDFSKTWDCNNLGLDHCENFRVYTNSQKTEGPYCGLARSIYGFEDPVWQRTASLYFNVTQSGEYNCNVSITETGYGYYNGPQTRENAGVYFNGFFLGNTTDGYCNSGTVCSDCRNFTSSFSFKRNLTANNNLIYLTPYQSHALRSVAVSCKPVPVVCAPTTETCDGRDNDCDGLIDENLIRSTNQTGVCSINTQTCQNGNWVNTSSNVNSSTETCDNLDNNCNGQIDENLIRSTNQLGACNQNNQTCTAGSWFNNSNNVFPTNEICDSKDNNCNGQIDEGLNCNPQCTTNNNCNSFNFNSSNYCYMDDVYKNSTVFSCLSNSCQANPLQRVFVSECGENSSLNSSLYCLGNSVAKNISSAIRGCNSGNCFINNQNSVEIVQTCQNGCNNGVCNTCTPTTEVCDNKDNDCDGQIDEGLNCGQVCNESEIRNVFSTNFCSGLNVLTNSSREVCQNNAWSFLVYNNTFNRTCSGLVELENQFCSGSNLVSNYSQPACLSGSCGESYFTNQTACAYGCNSTNNECNPPTDWPTCSIDYLYFSNGSNAFNISEGFFNQVGTFSVIGSANANSDDFLMRYVGYNRTSPNYIYYSWRAADNLGLWNSWKTDQGDLSFVSGTHTVCCYAESQRCFGEDNCELRVSNTTCESFCIDNQNPSVSINNIANMSNLHSTQFNWSWNSTDLGCAGLKYYNISLAYSNGTIIYQENFTLNTNLFSSGLLNQTGYILTVKAIDNAGNVGTASASIFVNLSGNASNCVENWVCGSWSSCSSGDQERSCQDTHFCGTNIFKPTEERECNEDDDEDSSSPWTPNRYNGNNSLRNSGSTIYLNSNLTNESGLILNKFSNSSISLSAVEWFWIILILLILLLIILIVYLYRRNN